MLQDLQWDGCRKETDYYEKSYGSRRNSDFRDTQVDIEDISWSVEAGLRTCQDNSSSIRYGGKDISFIRKNGHILRGGEHMLTSSQNVPILTNERNILATITNRRRIILASPKTSFNAPRNILNIHLSISKITVPTAPITLLIIISLLSTSIPLQVLQHLHRP